MPARSDAGRPAVDAVQQLALVPLRNTKPRLLIDEPDRLVFEQDKTYPRWLGPLPRFLGAPQTARQQLDGLSLQLWRRIDDRITLGALIDVVAADQQLTFNEARLLTLGWLRHLSEKGLVVLGDRTLGA